MFPQLSPTAQKLMTSIRRFFKQDWRGRTVDGCKPSEVAVLMCIRRGGKENDQGVMVTEISGALGITSPTVTQLTNGLVDQGLVERTADSKDRRVVRLKLSERGEQIASQAAASMRNSFHGLVEHLGEEKSLQLAELLNQTIVYFEEANKHSSQTNGGDQA